MTPFQPPPPAAPAAPRETKSALQEQIEQVQAAVDGSVRTAQAREAAAQAPAMGVVKNAEGHIVVTGRDGRQIVIDRRAVSDEDQVQELVRTALEPPRIPAPSRGPSGGDVAIVSIIFPSLIVIMLIVWRIVATSKRPGAAAGAAGASPDVAARLARIEQAIEAVAIEVERISESERYSARLLTERLPDPAPAAAPEVAAPTAAARAMTTADAVR